MKKFTSKQSDKAFTLTELLTVVAIVGILSAIAVPMYSKYVKRSRTSEAISNLGAIAMFEETFFSESSSYVTADPNPSGSVPANSDTGGRKSFSTGIAGWPLLGRVMPDGTNVYFQYEVRAGQYDSGGTAIATPGVGRLVTDTATSVPGGGSSGCSPAHTALSANSLSIPAIPSSNWFYATAVGNQTGGGKCSLFIKVVDRPDLYKENITD